MAEAMKVEGLAELQFALNELPRRLARKSIQKALRAAALPIRDDARSRVPVSSGTVRRNIVVQRSRVFTGKDGKFGVLVRVRRMNKSARAKGMSDPFYWRFLEFGTSKMPARPFLRPSFEGNKQAAVDTIAAQLREAIATAAKELNRGPA